MTTKTLAFGGLGAILLMFVAVPSMAGASIDGPCKATIGGTDLTQDDSVHLQSGQDVPFAFSAPVAITSYQMQLAYGPYQAAPSSGTVDSANTSASGTIPLSKFAWLGVGVYELTGTVNLENGGSCSGTVRVYVDGNPLTTAVGGTAAAVSGTTTIALVLLFLKDAHVLFQ